MTNIFDLTGRAAIVTGSAQGMGRVLAIAFVGAGADLVDHGLGDPDGRWESGDEW